MPIFYQAQPFTRFACSSMVLLVLSFSATQAADDKAPGSQTVKHRVTGLFSPGRQDDLRTVVEKIPNLKLVSIDYKNGEATFIYDRQKLFANAKPDEIVTRFDNLLKSASSHTFGIKPLSTVPKDKLVLIEIPVVGLDCQGCCLAAHEAIYNIEGVVQATASFKEGRVTALIDPMKTDRGALESTLKQKGVIISPK